MRKSKFEFPTKNIDPNNPMAIKAILKKEPFFTAQNATLLYQYFLSREFLSEIIKEDNDDTFILSGSSAFPAYGKPFRIPTDLDLQAKNSKKILELIFDTINKINNSGAHFKINLVSKGETVNNVFQFRADTKFYSMQDSFNLDIQVVKEQYNVEKKLLQKIITTDEEFLTPIQTVPTMISKKILSILDKAKSERGYYRTKDFYDIYMLAKQNANITTEDINQTLKQEIGRKIKENPAYDKYSLANTRDSLPKITENFETLWGKMKNRMEVDKKVTSANVKKFGIALMNEMSL